MSESEIHVVAFTAGMAALSSICLLPFGVAVAWLLARKEWRGKSIVVTLLTLPLVLPPVATGLILLKTFGRRGWFGAWLHDSIGVDVVFTWRGVIICMMVMSAPLLVMSARVAIEEVNPRLEQMARTLGAGNWQVFWSVTLPLARRGIAGGLILSFARALGEFGATILVAGNIPGKTTTLSMGIYQAVQTGDDPTAGRFLFVSVVIAFIAVWIGGAVIRRKGAGS